jgi:hypothetical protein
MHVDYSQTIMENKERAIVEDAEAAIIIEAKRELESG